MTMGRRELASNCEMNLTIYISFTAERLQRSCRRLALTWRFALLTLFLDSFLPFSRVLAFRRIGWLQHVGFQGRPA